MAGAPSSIREQLLARLHAPSIIGRHVRLEQAGRNFKGLCPFHAEKTPSFYVYPETASYHCFGCKSSGDVIHFLAEIENTTYGEALRSLARTVGMTLPQRGRRANPAMQKHYQMLARAQQFFRTNLNKADTNSNIVRYLSARGIGASAIQAFGLGYALDRWDGFKHSIAGNDEQLAIDAGLLVKHDASQRVYDRFRNRLMFPIRGIDGHVIGFGGRVIDEDDVPKYLNSPKTLVFDKGKELFGLYESLQHDRRPNRLLLVEGYTDVLTLAQHGVHNAVATLGTATSTTHMQRLFNTVDEVVCCFDGDEAGRTAAWRAMENAFPALREGCSLRFMFLPDGHDPDSLVTELGADNFGTRVDAATSVADYFVEQLTHGDELTSAQARIQFVESATRLIARIPPGATRRVLVQEIGDCFPERSQQISRLLDPDDATVARLPSSAKPSSSETKRKQTPYLRFLLHSPHIWAELDPKLLGLLQDCVPNSPLVDVWYRIAGDTELVENPSAESLLASFQAEPKSYEFLHALYVEPQTPCTADEFNDAVHTYLSSIERIARRHQLRADPTPENIIKLYKVQNTSSTDASRN